MGWNQKWSNTAEVTGEVTNFSKKDVKIIVVSWKKDSKKLKSFQKLLDRGTRGLLRIKVGKAGVI